MIGTGLCAGWAILGSNQWPLRCERSALPLRQSPLLLGRLPDPWPRRSTPSAAERAFSICYSGCPGGRVVKVCPSQVTVQLDVAQGRVAPEAQQPADALAAGSGPASGWHRAARVVVIDVRTGVTERLTAHGTGVALVLHHLVKPGLGDAEPGELPRLVPARPVFGRNDSIGPAIGSPLALVLHMRGGGAGRGMARAAGAVLFSTRHPLTASRLNTG